MDRYEAKQRYIERKNTENAKIETLTEDQHEALEGLCRMRHNIHSTWDRIFNSETIENSDFNEYLFGDEGSTRDGIINKTLSEAGLDIIDFKIDISDIPDSNWYYTECDEEEQQAWEEKAKAAGYPNGFTCWKETSGIYDQYADTMTRINSLIEDYLADIDTKHETHYAPSGMARLR